MKAWVPLVLLGAALSGCAGGSDTGNPNLVAPKVVLALRADGNLTLYLHSAFGEHRYDWLEVRVDNATIANRTSAFSLEESTNATGFFLDVAAEAQGQLYQYRARVDLARAGATENLRVATVDDEGTWSEPRSFGLPYQQILDHPRSA